MHITEQMVRKLIDSAEAAADEFYNSAHSDLVAIDEDLWQDDARARQGLGMAPNRPTIDTEAKRLLDEYMSNH